MKIKECVAQVKAAGDNLTEGQFTAVVSVFGNVDSYGDVVLQGAFTDTLAAWKASGNPIPVIWSHDWADPFSHIGAVTEAEETDQGLQVTGQLDLDNAKASQVYRLLKSGRVTQFSFAYDVEEGAIVETEDSVYYELRKLKLYEVGPTLVGANQETELLAVKADALRSGLKQGRQLGDNHLENINATIASLQAVIAETKTTPDDHAGDDAEPTGDASRTQDASRPDDTADAAADAPDRDAEAAAERVKSVAALDLARLTATIEGAQQ